MRKELAEVGIMSLIVVRAVIYGIKKTYSKVNLNEVHVNTTIIDETSNSTISITQTGSQPDTAKRLYNSTASCTEPRLPAVQNASHLLYSIRLVNVAAKTSNNTAVHVGDVYYVQLTGLFIHPPSYIPKGNYSLFIVGVSFTSINETKETLHLPVYQKVVLTNQSTLKTILQLDGNSVTAVQLYNYIKYRKMIGIYHVETPFCLLLEQNMDNFYYYVSTR